jgi:hypothetical protein
MEYGGAWVINMPERMFKVLASVESLPSMASCTKCGYKFFTPRNSFHDPAEADEYLRDKFANHRCPDSGAWQSKRTGFSNWYGGLS